MKFYNRHTELDSLGKVHQTISKSSKMTVLTGRRRIGKTRLILEFAEGKTFLYFFISRKEEILLCKEYTGYVKSQLGIPVYGEITSLIDLFQVLFDYSRQNELVIIVDEFQEIMSINSSFISDFQRLWDTSKFHTHVHLIISGSIYSIMQRIFIDAKEPLFGRADLFIKLNRFPIATLKEFLSDNSALNAENLLALYVLTGGVPRYLEVFSDSSCYSLKEVVDLLIAPHSLFIEEGKHLLIEEFGKDYQMYFTILELLSTGKTSRVEIESILGKSVGGFLERLESVYEIILPFRPIGSKKGSRSIKYKIRDPFIAFWFAYFYRFRSAIEANNFSYVKKELYDSYSQYAGYWLQRLFEDIYREGGKCTRLGSYWERGFQNEIDLVAIDDSKNKIVVAEIKMQKKNIRRELLKHKTGNLLTNLHLNDYKIHYRYLSLEDLI